MTLSILRPDSAAVSEFTIEHAFEYRLDSILVVAAGGTQLVDLGTVQTGYIANRIDREHG